MLPRRLPRERFYGLLLATNLENSIFTKKNLTIIYRWSKIDLTEYSWMMDAGEFVRCGAEGLSRCYAEVPGIISGKKDRIRTYLWKA